MWNVDVVVKRLVYLFEIVVRQNNNHVLVSMSSNEHMRSKHVAKIYLMLTM